MSEVVAFVPDLMDRSKVAAAGADVAFVNRPADLPAAAAGARLVVLDLMRPGVLAVIPEIEAPVIGFANHAERQVMDDALAAGCQKVMARSAFFANVSELLS